MGDDLRRTAVGAAEGFDVEDEDSEGVGRGGTRTLGLSWRLVRLTELAAGERPAVEDMTQMKVAGRGTRDNGSKGRYISSRKARLNQHPQRGEQDLQLEGRQQQLHTLHPDFDSKILAATAPTRAVTLTLGSLPSAGSHCASNERASRSYCETESGCRDGKREGRVRNRKINSPTRHRHRVARDTTSLTISLHTAD